MKACFLIAECSLSYAKIVPTSAMKACFLIAECSLSYAKIQQFIISRYVIKKKSSPDKIRLTRISLFSL